MSSLASSHHGEAEAARSSSDEAPLRLSETQDAKMPQRNLAPTCSCAFSLIVILRNRGRY